METLSTTGRSQKNIGALRSTAHVFKTVTKDPGTRHSANRVVTGTKTVGRVGAGITNEIVRNEEVRQAAKKTGWFALEGAGVIRYSAKTGKRVPNAKGIERALAFPELAIKDAVVAGRKSIPSLAEAVMKAAPDSMKDYHRKNPGALREAATATAEVAKGAVTLPFYVGAAAVNGIKEVRASNRALEEDAAKYRALLLPINGEVSVSGPNLHTANDLVHSELVTPASTEQKPQPSNVQLIRVPETTTTSQTPKPDSLPHGLAAA